MKNIIILISAFLFSSLSYAAIPYCSGTAVPIDKDKDQALQYVVTQFAAENGCKIGNNCLSNFDEVKYFIGWTEPCIASAKRGNDPNSSTFICSRGICQPYGFFSPIKSYANKFFGDVW
ncbi:MAG: hypothetical protein K0S27_790 [Gammaproteobacteria bacterium]|nr:hypothetical protein [Gammaproteobacteria bacterium]